MSTNDIDLFSDEPEITANSSPEPTTIPDKYKGKTVEDLITMHRNAEKLIGRQSAEVATLRSVTDRFADKTSRQEITQPVVRQPVTVEGLLNDPDKTLQSAIDNSDLVKRTEAAEARAARVEAKFGERDFVSKYPAFKDDMEDPAFNEFIQKNTARKALADSAARGNFDDASSLWDMWEERKELTGAKETPKAKARPVPSTMRATSKDGQSSSRKFSRTKIEALRDKAEAGDIGAKQRWNDPEFQKELGQAHLDGRVV